MKLWIPNETQDKNKHVKIRFQKGMNKVLKNEFILFIKWIKENYYFPEPLNIYFFEAEKIFSDNGEMVYGTFWRPEENLTQARIRIATGDFDKLIVEKGIEKAVNTNFLTFFNLLTYYYQWVAGLNKNEFSARQQALYFARKIVNLYYEVAPPIDEDI